MRSGWPICRIKGESIHGLTRDVGSSEGVDNVE